MYLNNKQIQGEKLFGIKDLLYQMYWQTK